MVTVFHAGALLLESASHERVVRNPTGGHPPLGWGVVCLLFLWEKPMNMKKLSPSFQAVMDIARHAGAGMTVTRSVTIPDTGTTGFLRLSVLIIYGNYIIL